MVDVQKEIGNIEMSDEDGSVSAEVSPPGNELICQPLEEKKPEGINSNITPEFDYSESDQV